MSEDLLRQVAADLNFASDAASRVPRMAALMADNNRRIADVPLPFDSTPYAMPLWLAAADKR
ncbi:MAG: hypothetical protein JWR89_3941 [Tardiphaga sp.]|jgi:hypothetical protein|uniref:hypothetical protein n=1 Tax=Tardiphaga sp. TaxID=1926292 RepID=UPI002607F337|nr:hypothetical protein [Tardiphaga sp.]MDB5504039.1 hypothetical protein [Tardiphaga sp.]